MGLIIPHDFFLLWVFEKKCVSFGLVIGYFVLFVSFVASFYVAVASSLRLSVTSWYWLQWCGSGS
jgi:hypothetical protein